MNVLIINGHPGKDTFNHALAGSFETGAKQAGATIKTLNVNSMGLTLEMVSNAEDLPLSPKIKQAQELVLWADHLVWVFPTWWATMPALLKAFFEQVFTSGFAFKYKKSKKNVKWDKLLPGKTAQMISTMDAPPWYYNYFIGEPAFKMLRYNLKFCGFKSVKRTYFGSVKTSTAEQKEKWLKEAEQLGAKLK